MSLQEAQERVQEAVDEMETVLNRLNGTTGMEDEKRREYLTRYFMSFLRRKYGIDTSSAKTASTTVGRQELSKRISQTTKISQKQAAEVLEATLDSIREALQSGDEVRLVGFGSFKVRKSAARKGVNPRDRSTIEVPAKDRVRFFPGKELSDAVLKKK